MYLNQLQNKTNVHEMALTEILIISQVSSATATFAMMFSSSMSVVEYYLLKRFPVPYGKLGPINL